MKTTKNGHCPFCGTPAEKTFFVPDDKGKRIACERCKDDDSEHRSTESGIGDPFWKFQSEYHGGYSE